jgi:hypothetical protein
MHRLLRSRVLLAVLALFLVLAAVGGWLLVRPAPDPPGRADVLLVLAGGRGVRVLCLHSEIDTTRGEARAFAELAGREGWRSVTVVTSSYHRHRAGLLVSRCFPGTVHTVGASPNRAGPVIAPVAAREGAALLATLTVQQGC